MLSAKYCELVDDQHDTHVVFSLRNNLLKDKIVNGHFRILRLRERILHDYETKTILNLSKTFDYPPRLLLKAIFAWKRVPAVDKLFGYTDEAMSLSDSLCPRDKAQYHLAVGCDANPVVDGEIAMRHEREFVAMFENIPHKTEVQLQAEGSKTTPDILFIRPILINGTEIYWIDYKDYVGAPRTFLTKKMRDQAKKYTDAYGQGAFVFNGGFIEGLSVGAVLLRAQDCPLGKFSPS
jgi:hypothetical protein